MRVQNDKVRYVRPDGEEPFLLMDERKVNGIGPDKDIIRLGFLGEAPGKEEAETGEPFVGQAGKTLNSGFHNAGIYRNGVYLTNVINRRPPKNDISSPEAKELLKLSKPELWKELRWLVEERGLRVLVALGTTAKNALGIDGSISKVRGSVYEINLDWEGPVTDPSAEPCHFVVVVTYHPSYIQRTQWGSKSENAVWYEDLRKALDIATKGYERPVEDFITSPTVEDVSSFIKQAIDEKQLLAVDIETASLTPRKDAIVCIGLAKDGQSGICVPFYETGEHVRPYHRYWDQSAEPIVMEWLQKAFKQCKLMFQNALFDVDYLHKTGWSVPIENVEHDTMLLHHALNPELSHKLGYITSVYGVTPYWKEDFLKRDTSIWGMDFKLLQEYNLRDCIVLHQVLNPMLEDLDEYRTHEAYKESMSLIGPVLMMQSTGVKLDKKELSRYKRLKTQERDNLAKSLTAGLPDYFELSKDDHIRLLLFGIYPKAYEAAKTYTKHKEGSKVRQTKYELYQFCQECTPFSHGYGGRTTRGGDKISVDKQGLLGLQIYASGRLGELDNLKRRTEQHDEEEKELKRLVQWLKDFREWRRLNKLITTYTKFHTEDDGRLHTRFLIHGTVSGRLSSRAPNFQNFPKQDKDYRKIFVASDDHVIVSADYSNLEFRVLAYETGDPKLIKIIEDGLNQHDENTKAMFDIDESDPRWEPCRRAAKTFQFGSQYGGGDRQVYEQICLQVPEMNLTYSRFRSIKNKYMMTYRGYVEWAERVKAQASEKREVWNSFGRCRQLFGKDKDIGKEALNFPCQSGAAHIINEATYKIWNELRRGKYRSRLQAQIHDQLVIEAPIDELDRVARLLKAEMERPVDYNGQYIVFPVDLEVGTSWGELHPYEA